MLSGKLCLFVSLGSGILAAQPVVQSIVNAASSARDLSPGSMAVVQGAGFGADAVLKIGDSTVTPMPGSAFANRFNVYLPGDLAPGTYQAVVTTAAGRSAAFPLTLAAASPAFYTVTNGDVTAGAFFDNSFLALTVEKGAVRNTTITAYANGLGPADGKPPLVTARLPLKVTVQADDGSWKSMPATARQDSSLAGYWQVQFTMPDGMTQGMHDTYLSAGATDGPRVSLPVGGAILRAVVNAGSNAKSGAVAPGSLIAIYGTELTPQDQANLFPSTTLPGGGQVRIGGIAAPLSSVSMTYQQANIVAPWEVAPADAVDVVIENSFGLSRPYRVRVTESAVGMFRLVDPSKAARQNVAALIRGTSWAAIPLSMAAALKIPRDCRANAVDADKVCGQPAAEGDVVQIYATGLGKVAPSLATGRAAPADGSVLHRTVAAPQVTIGGVPATVVFSGMAPGFAGVYQVDVVVPKDVTPGDDVPVAITMPAGDRDTATIAIR